MLTPTSISRSEPMVGWLMVRLVCGGVLPLEGLSTAGGGAPAGRIATPPMAQCSSVPGVQDMVPVAAPGSVLPDPGDGRGPSSGARFQRSVWPAPTGNAGPGAQ